MNSKMRKIILIRPGPKGSIRTFPPFGIFYIASVLKSKGYEVKILDLANFDSEDEFIDEIKSGPLCVGISSMSGSQLRYAMDCARTVKKINSRIPVILGGVHVSIFPQQSLESDLFDIGVIGEGEITMLELADALSTGKTLHGICGVAFKECGRVFVNKDRGFIRLEILPRLDYNLIRVERYIDRSISFMVHTGRGCCYKCKFCYNSFMGEVYRHLPVEAIIDDIKMLNKEFKVKEFAFIDDNFFCDSRFLKSVCSNLLNSGLHIGWHGSARVSEFVKLDENMLDLIKGSGCKSVAFGVESGSQRMLDFIGKRIYLPQIKRLRAVLSKYDFKGYFHFIFGLPTEEKNDFLQTLKIINMLYRGSKKSILDPTCFLPYPGTELYDYVLEKGLFTPPKTIDEWSFLDWNICRIESFTKKFDPSLRAVEAVFRQKDRDFIRNILYYILFFLIRVSFILFALNRLLVLKDRIFNKYMKKCAY